MRRTLVIAIALAFLGSAADAKPKRKRKPRPAPSAPRPEEPKAPEPTPAGDEPETPAKEAAPKPTPAPTPAPPAGAPAEPVPPAEAAGSREAMMDVDRLRQEYLALRDQLFRSRARAATVASSVYSSVLRIDLHYQSGRFYRIDRATIRLDGAGVFDDGEGVIAENKAPRWQGFVAPGRHVVTVRIEATARDDGRFTTIQESAFSIQAPAGKEVVVTCTARDEGDIAHAWPRTEKGRYRLGLDVAVDTREREGAPRAKGKR
jgi:hypothetical protein